MLKVYITDLAAYNKGFLIGEWVNLPMSGDELSSAIAKVLKGGEAICAMEYGYEMHEEWFITDYEWSDIELFEVEEYMDVYALNKDIKRVEGLSIQELKAIRFLFENAIVTDVNKAIGELDDVIVYEDTTMEDLAYSVLEDCYEIYKLPAIIANHIDYTAVARTFEYEGRYTMLDNDIFEYVS